MSVIDVSCDRAIVYRGVVSVIIFWVVVALHSVTAGYESSVAFTLAGAEVLCSDDDVVWVLTRGVESVDLCDTESGVSLLSGDGSVIVVSSDI